MSTQIAVNIRPHLVSFLFKELEGETKAEYKSKKVKLARVTKRSSLGQLLYIFKARAYNEAASKKVTNYNIFLSVDAEDPKQNQATINQRINITHSQLFLLDEDVKFINNYLEGLFRLSLVNFVKGYVKHDTSSEKNNKRMYSYISTAIHEFMLDHNLYDTETDPEALRRLYYREVKKNHLLHRFQIPISTQIKHFAML